MIKTVGFAADGETYSNSEAGIEVTFPTFYEEASKEKEDKTIISLNCTYRNMIFLVSVFLFDDPIPEDEYAVKVAEDIVLTADALKSKFKKKKLEPWSASGAENYGLKNRIKGKVPESNGGFSKCYGYNYITISGGIEYRFTILTSRKSSFDKEIATNFINSVKLL
ncbi:MAG: hypothetical protein HUJ25_06955 [Crocinitomicaceae bacterium]|nr:hypothetical protein [Crocinitomicaceae bacterium]